MTISRQSPLPLYAQVRQILERELVEKQMQPGQMLPSEDDLARRFHVSRMTIRRALDQLVSQGRLRRVQGQGTFVADERPAPRPAGLTRWSFERIAGDDPVTRELVSVEQVSPRLRIANALHTMPGERVVELTFRLSCGNRILGISVSSIPQLLVGGVCDWEMGDKTLSEHLAGCCSLQFGKVGERVRGSGRRRDGRAAERRAGRTPAVRRQPVAARIGDSGRGYRVAFHRGGLRLSRDLAAPIRRVETV